MLARMTTGAKLDPQLLAAKVYGHLAQVLNQHYGDDALSIATERAEALALQNDMEGAAVWLGVIQAIKDLTSTTPSGSVH